MQLSPGCLVHSKRFTLLFLGTEGLLWSPHVWTAVESRSFYPHQLDRPRRERLLLILQRLKTLVTRRRKQDGGPRLEGQSSAREDDIFHAPSWFWFLPPTPVTLIKHLTPHVVAVLFIHERNFRFCVICCQVFDHSEKGRGNQVLTPWMLLIECWRSG